MDLVASGGDQFGQVIEVLVSPKRGQAATRRFFTQALGSHAAAEPGDYGPRAPASPRALDDLLAATCHVTEQVREQPAAQNFPLTLAPFAYVNYRTISQTNH